MSALLVVLGLLSLWVAKQVIASLIGQQVRGSIPDFNSAMARRAALLLPPELADDYLEDWLAELEAIENKPLSAIRFARGLPKAARAIRADAGLGALSPSYATISRAFEINFSLFFLAFMAPTLFAIALAVKVDAGGPIFVRRIRSGRGGTPIFLLGFRTIQVDHEGGKFAKTNPRRLNRHQLKQPAYTRIGSFLNRTSLVSLPTLFNVLRGELALVGPPPQRVASDERPLAVRPGIFSWQGLVEMYGCDIEIAEARRRDCARSFRSDLRLLATVFRVEVLGRPSSS